MLFIGDNSHADIADIIIVAGFIVSASFRSLPAPLRPIGNRFTGFRFPPRLTGHALEATIEAGRNHHDFWLEDR